MLSVKGIRLITVVTYWIAILLGPLVPWASLILTDVAVRHIPLAQTLHDFRAHLFAPGYNLFLIGILNTVPFLAFALLALFHLGMSPLEDSVRTSRRFAGIASAGLAITAVSIWIHVTILLHPDAQGAIAYLFLPMVLLVLLPVGYVVGRLIGTLLVHANTA